MKKSKILALILVPMLAFACGVGLTACKSGEKITLSAPVNVQINAHNKISWNKVNNASGYNLLIGSDTVNLTKNQNEYDLSAVTIAGFYTVKVQAIGNGKKYLDSVSTWVEYIVGTAGLDYVPYNGTYMVRRGLVTTGDVYIKKYHEGVPVTGIPVDAFNDSVTPLTITSVTIPASVNNIYGSAFAGCASLERVNFGSGSVLEGISLSAFFGCSSLESIIIPASVETISFQAFIHCTGLKSVIFAEGNSIETIGQNAFWGCTSLMSIVIPASVKTINEAAFSGVPGSVEVYYGRDISYGEWGVGITFGTNNDSIKFASCLYYSPDEPEDDLYSYWRWVDGVPTAWATA